MVEAVLKSLVVILVAVALVWIAIWALALGGIVIPANILLIIYGIVILLVLLYLWRKVISPHWAEWW